MITIAIATYQRLDSLRTLISQIKTHTKGEYNLIVSVDGSTDGTVEYLRDNRINHIFSENRGVGHAKNLAMWWFEHQTKDDVLILLEDDCRIWEDNWSEHWVYIANYFHYVNFYEGQQTDETKLFNMSPSPMMVKRFGGAVMAMSRKAIEKVGYMDPELTGYGFEHVEWTCRVYQTFKDIWQGDENHVPGYNQHVGVEYRGSNFNEAVFIQNWRKAIALLNSDKPIYRKPFLGGEMENHPTELHFKACIDNAVIFNGPIPNLCVGQICPLCGCTGKHIGYRDEYPIRECCGVLLSFPYEDKSHYEQLYVNDGDYHEKEQLREGQPSFWDRDEEFLKAAQFRLRLIDSWLPIAQNQVGLIDIGSGTGAFIEKCKEFDLPAIGVEPNEAMVVYAVDRNRDVRLASWETLEHVMLRGPCAAYITAFDVFEHLTNPVGFLEAMKESLLPGGILVIEMPEIACPQQMAEGLQWKHIRPRQNICMYSDAAAQKLFARCGWRVEALHRPRRGQLGKICYFLSAA